MYFDNQLYSLGMQSVLAVEVYNLSYKSEKNTGNSELTLFFIYGRCLFIEIIIIMVVVIQNIIIAHTHNIKYSYKIPSLKLGFSFPLKNIVSPSTQRKILIIISPIQVQPYVQIHILFLCTPLYVCLYVHTHLLV